MIKEFTGNVFDVYCDIRINTVNCVGVMGAGIAREFKDRYPAMFEDYAKRCRRRTVVPGCPFLWEGNLTKIINFPTKNHWRNSSEYEYIENGLVWLNAFLSEMPSLTIAIPPLGCGHGGLKWDIVKPMIVDHLKELNHDILLFQPSRYPHVINEKKRRIKGTTQWHT